MTDSETKLPESQEGDVANSTAGADTSVQQVLDDVVGFLGSLPGRISEFFSKYRQLLTLIGIVLLGGISAKLLFAVLGAINELPLLAPLFELIGIGYTTWFVVNYLFNPTKRGEFLNSIGSLTQQFFGSHTEQ